MSDVVETRFFPNALKSDSELPGAARKVEMMTSPQKAHPATVAGDEHWDLDLVRLANRTTYRIGPEQRVEVGGF